MPKSNDDVDIDELLRQADGLLQEETPEDGQDSQDYTPAFEESMDMDNTIVYRNAANHYGSDIRNAANGYGAGRSAPEYQPDIPPIRAYNADFHSAREDSPVQSARRPSVPPARKSQTSARSASRPTEAAVAVEKPAPRKKRRRGCLTGLIILVLVIAAGVAGLNMLIYPPKTDQPIGSRKSGTSAILLCGADIGGERTDTMMLLFVDAREKTAGLLTLPRDTYTMTAYGLEVKLNSAYGRNGGGEEGMEVLLDYVQRLIGFRPDGYMLVELPALRDLVDLMGGVDFAVPQDMTFDGMGVGENISLEEGMQHLDGEQAMGLLRFRYGYYNQDLGRQDVQKQFLKACMKQWVTPGNLKKFPEALKLLEQQSFTNLTTGNFLWFGWNLMRCGFSNISTDTLPGYATMIGDQSFYVLEPEAVAEMVQDRYNPYKQEITVEDLEIVTE